MTMNLLLVVTTTTQRRPFQHPLSQLCCQLILSRRFTAGAAAYPLAPRPPASPILSNEQIHFSKVRVVSESNAFIGDFATSDALELARRKQRDLILISATSVPPICKLDSLQNVKNNLEEAGGRELKSLVAFDPGRSTKFVRFKAKADEYAFARQLKLAREFLNLGFETNILIMREGQTSSKVAELIQTIATELKDVGVATNIPNKKSDIRSAAVVQMEFKPSKGEVLTPEMAGINPIVDDEPLAAMPEPEERKNKKFTFEWAKRPRKKEQVREEDHEAMLNYG